MIRSGWISFINSKNLQKDVQDKLPAPVKSRMSARWSTHDRTKCCKPSMFPLFKQFVNAVGNSATQSHRILGEILGSRRFWNSASNNASSSWRGWNIVVGNGPTIWFSAAMEFCFTVGGLLPFLCLFGFTVSLDNWCSLILSSNSVSIKTKVLVRNESCTHPS